MLFNHLVKSIMACGADIWGWNEIKGLEKKAGFLYPQIYYLQKNESERMKIEWGKRAVKYEEKFLGYERENLMKEC